MIAIEKVNDVYNKVYCEPAIAQELADYFTFDVPGAKFSPQFKNRYWDGKIRLYSTATKLLYRGLLEHVKLFAKEREYEIVLENPNDFTEETFTDIQAKEYIAKLKSLTKQPRDYQMQAFTHAVRKSRALLLSPTASGKSLIIYLLSRYYRFEDKKALIIVPTTSLVHQMASDFESYGCPEGATHKIFSGQEKMTQAPFVITTWQSIYKLPRTWFEQFYCIIGDEAHLFKAKSLTSIMTKLIDCPYRFGFTGTLDGSQTNKLVLEGLFGPVKKVITTAELIQNEHLSNLNIRAIILNYEDELRKAYKSATYFDEVDFLAKNDDRNKFIRDLSLSLKGNTLILFKTIDQGTTLFNMIKDMSAHDKVFYVDGSVDGLVREDIRKAVENEKNSIIVASYGTFSTGINIQNLHNIIFASPSKSRIRTLQSIGRGLRKGEFKTEAVLYDIADDLSWKSRKNHTLNHFAERMKIYNEEKFNYKIYSVRLKNDDGIFSKTS